MTRCFVLHLLAVFALALAADAQVGPPAPELERPMRAQRKAIDVDLGETIELHPTERIQGLVIVGPPVPKDEVLRVTMEAWIAPADQAYISLKSLSSFHPEAVFEVLASVEVNERRRFTLPRIASAPPKTVVRVRLEGLYSFADDLLFIPGGEEDPGEEIKIRAEVGGCLTLRLLPPADVTEAERAALVGRAVVVEGQHVMPANSSTFRFPERYERFVAEDLTVTIGGVDEFDLQLLEPDHVSGPEEGLAPFFVSNWRRIRLGSGDRDTMELRLTRGMELSGMVVDSGGAPFQDARVDVIGQASPPYSSMRGPTTQEDGSFALYALRPDVHQLVVSAEGFLAVRVGAEVFGRAMPGDRIKLPPIEMSRGNVLYGRVVFADGKPASSVSVALKTAEEEGPGGSPQAAITDADGRFSVSALRDAQVSVFVDGWRLAGSETLISQRPLQPAGGGGGSLAHVHMFAHAGVRAAETSKSDPVLLEMGPMPVLRGRIVDPTGASLEEARLYLGGESVMNWGWQYPEWKGPFGAPIVPFDPVSGEFEIEDLPGLRFAIYAQAGSGDHPRSSQLVKLHLSDVPERVELILAVLPSVGGRVVNGEGQPVEGARVIAGKWSGQYAREWRSAVTDAAGAFTLVDLAHGEYRLTVDHPEYLVAEPVAFTTPAAGAKEVPLGVTVLKGGLVEVGYPPKWGMDGRAAKPTLRLPDGQWLRVARPRTSPGRGVARMGPVLAGSYVVQYSWSGDARRRTHVVYETVEVRPSETVTVMLDGESALRHTVQGMAHDRADAGLADYVVEVWRDGLSFGSARTNHRGQFELMFQASGALEARLLAPGSRQVIARASLEVPDEPGASPLEVRWTVGTCGISGSMSSDELHHQSLGTLVEFVPEGEDPTVRVPGRSVQVQGSYTSGDGRQVPSRFRLEHLDPGTYTLVAWRRAPEDGPYMLKRSQPAAKPRTIRLGAGEQRKGVVLTVIAPPALMGK